MRLRSIQELVVAVAGFSALTGISASASVIGTLNTGSGGTVTVTLTSLTFNPDPSATPVGTAGNGIDGEVASGTTLMFQGCSGALGSAGCLFVTEGIIFSPGTLSAGTPPDPDFLTFAGIPAANLNFSLLGYGAGSTNTDCSSLAIGDSCSVVPGAPLVLTRTAQGTQASFVVLGKAFDLSGGGGSNYVGQFNAPIAGETPAQLQAFFCPGGVCNLTTSVSTSTSGNFVATLTPEPSTLALVLGSLLVGVGAVRRRKAQALR